jgi:DNA-binding transcriptional MocR family regulator
MSDTISFARGAPSLDIVDVEGLKASALEALSEDPGGATGYGAASGYGPLRSWIAKQHGVDEDQVVVTNGSMQADAFLFDALVSKGDSVVVERPTYDRTLLGLLERGAEVEMIELEADGIDTAALRAALEAGLRPRFAHIIPNFQNPAGYTLSEAKRGELLELAEQYDFLIFEDDPYIEIRFSGEPLPTMLSLDGPSGGRVVYASSFSKTVCPGIRVGYLVGPRELIAQITKAATNTYISPDMIAQAIVYRFCESGRIEESVKTVSAALSERVAALTAALDQHLPEAEYNAPEGGYFMWVELPEGTDVAALEKAAGERDVVFVKGADFVIEGATNQLRLAYSGVTPEQISEGIERLADAYRSL